MVLASVVFGAERHQVSPAKQSVSKKGMRMTMSTIIPNEEKKKGVNE